MGFGKRYEREPYHKKFEEVAERAASGGFQERVSKGVSHAFERAAGEAWIHHDDAPDREDFYDESQEDDGYADYLRACEEWARQDLATGLNDMQDQLTELESTDLPSTTDVGPEANEQRESFDARYTELIEMAEELGEYREAINKVHRAWKHYD